MIATKANVIKWAERASDAAIIEGMDWYDNARDFCTILAHEYQLPVEDIAAAFAALSPRIDLASNYTACAKLVHSVARGNTPAGATIAGVASNVNKAHAILYSGWESVDWSKAPKTWAFFQNIIDPTSHEITIDIWAERVCYDDPTFRTNGGPAGARYAACATAYLDAAAELRLQPAVLQAITWVSIKEWGKQLELL